MSVTVVDYGSGNLHSVAKALRHVGAEVLLTSDPAAVEAASHLVLPGVGAFADCRAGLVSRGLFEPVRRAATSGRPFLGICVGMQLLFSVGLEFGSHDGLGVLPGHVAEIPRDGGVKVPHVGWNRVHPARDGAWEGTPFAALEPGAMVYFVHSFAAQPDGPEARLADCQYGPHRLCAAAGRGRVWGCQFHPEMSGEAGLAVLRAFVTAS